MQRYLQESKSSRCYTGFHIIQRYPGAPGLVLLFCWSNRADIDKPRAASSSQAAVPSLALPFIFT